MIGFKLTRIKCLYCGIEFDSKRSHTKFCSRLCRRREESNRLCCNTQKRISNQVNSRFNQKKPHRRYNKLLHKCLHYKIPCNIKESEFIQLLNLPCHYCKSNTLLDSTGVCLDRVKPDLGYTLDNVLPCCGPCNQIRNVHLTVEEMEVAMAAVLSLRNKDNLKKSNKI